MATITALPCQVPESVVTVTVRPAWARRLAGALRTTRAPRCSAMRIEMSWEPPTKRESWAPPAVLVRLMMPLPEW
jgi:hypothetical protein